MQRTVFFYFGTDLHGTVNGYPHSSLVLAEGFRELGWKVQSDVPYWRITTDSQPLFLPKGDSDPKDSDLIIFNEEVLAYDPNLVSRARRESATSLTIYIDRSDIGSATLIGVTGPGADCDLILRCHWNGKMRYRENCRPWAFAISDRIRNACSSNSERRVQQMVWNYRRKNHHHSSRQFADSRIQPEVRKLISIDSEIDSEESTSSNTVDELYRLQTDGRHSPSYYKRLQRATACACFCGWFLLPVRQQEAGLLCRMGRRLLKSGTFPTRTICQWDSWRLWESFAAGTAVVHFDFELHGMVLPEMPVNGVHYIGVDPRNIEKSLRPLSDPVLVRQIGENGRQWALKHYTPKAMAERLLTMLKPIRKDWGTRICV
ncbi:MAG: hypothetical protein QM754_00250 [Tepidisphaeraceae bacterium]